MSSNDLIVKGNENSSGGQFDKVKLNGNAKVNGDVECKEFECSGKGKVIGNVTAHEIEIDGNCKILGKIIADELEIQGVSKVDGHSKIKEIDVDGRVVFCDELEAEEIKADGECKVFGNVQSNKIHINGFLSVGKDCDSRIFSCNGKMNVEGRLTAEKIDMKLFWDSEVKEIYGNKVVIEQVNKFFVKLISKFINPCLHVEEIEADEVNISFTKAKVVRGKNVVLGNRCEVDVVEYTENYRADPKAKVGKVLQV